VLVIMATDLLVASFGGGGAASLHDYLGGTRVVFAEAPGVASGTLFRRAGALAVDWWLIAVGICLAGGFASNGFTTDPGSRFQAAQGWLVAAAVVFLYLGVLPVYWGKTLGGALFRLEVVGGSEHAGRGRRFLATLVYPAPLCGLMVMLWLTARATQGAIVITGPYSELVHMDRMEPVFQWLHWLRYAYLTVGAIMAADVGVALLPRSLGRSLHDFLGGTRLVSVAQGGVRSGNR
jgi:hypothetical protein